MEYTKDIVRQDSKQYTEVKLQIKFLHCELGFKIHLDNSLKNAIALCALSNLMWWLLPTTISKMLHSEQSFVYVLNES